MTQTEIPSTIQPGRLRCILSPTRFKLLCAKARKLNTKSGALVFIAIREAVPTLEHRTAPDFTVSQYMGEVYIFLKLSVHDIDRVNVHAARAGLTSSDFVARLVVAKYFTRTTKSDQPKLF